MGTVKFSPYPVSENDRLVCVCLTELCRGFCCASSTENTSQGVLCFPLICLEDPSASLT